MLCILIDLPEIKISVQLYFKCVCMCLCMCICVCLRCMEKCLSVHKAEEDISSAALSFCFCLFVWDRIKNWTFSSEDGKTARSSNVSVSTHITLALEKLWTLATASYMGAAISVSGLHAWTASTLTHWVFSASPVMVLFFVIITLSVSQRNYVAIYQK